MKKILTVCALIAIVSSCKKSDDTVASLAITKENIAGTYKITAESTSVNGSAAADTYNTSYDACERDDTYAFTAAGSITFTDAGVKCTPPGATISTTYTLSGSQLTFLGQTATIESLTSTSLTYSYSYTVGSTTAKVTSVLTRQ